MFLLDFLPNVCWEKRLSLLDVFFSLKFVMSELMVDDE